MYPMVFILVCDLGRQGGVSKLIRNTKFGAFLAVSDVLSIFLVTPLAYITTAWNYNNVTCRCVPDGFYFAFRSRLTREEYWNF